MRSPGVSLILLATLLSVPRPVHAQSPPISLHNLELVGSLPLSLRNADVWGHGDYAYVGTWPFDVRDCPGDGVKIVDIRDPAAPRLVATAARESNTDAEDMVVRRVATPFFQGDLLAVGLQLCNRSQPGRRGLALFDVTSPTSPRSLGFFDTGFGSPGVHELDLLVKGERAFALLAAYYFQPATCCTGRFLLVEVTDPRNPVQMADWDLTERLGEPLSGPPPLDSKFAHSALASRDGTLAFVSYFDAGVIILDISNPAEPRYLGRTGFGPGEQGNAHSVAVSDDNRLLLVAHEVLSAGNAPPYNDFGFLRLFDISNPAQPRELAIFQTPDSRVDPQRGPTRSGGWLSVHNPFLVGDLAFLSWLADGVRVLDVSNPRRPQEVGWALTPRQNLTWDHGRVWGVYVDSSKENLILASDIDFGLYLFRPLRPEPNPGGVLDAASFATTALGDARVGAPVAPGAIVSLFGRNLAGASAGAEAQPLPQRLAGSAVRVNGSPAQLFYVSPEQINFLLPETTSPGTARVIVENAGRRSAEVAVQMSASAPGIFTVSQDGRGLAAALRASDQSRVDSSRPARPGEVIEIFLSGLNRAAPSVTVGGRPAELLFAGLPPGFVGLWQINFRVPAGVQGTVEIRVTAGGTTSNGALLPVE